MKRFFVDNTLAESLGLRGRAMLRFLDRFSLEARLFMALGLPVIAVFWMTATGVFERYREVVELREVETLSRLSVQIGSLVHQLQFERGVSYVYLGSGGSAFHEQLRAARAATDERTDELQKYCLLYTSPSPRD